MTPNGHRSVEILMNLFDLTDSPFVNGKLYLFVPWLIVPSKAWCPLAVPIDTFLANEFRVARLNSNKQDRGNNKQRFTHLTTPVHGFLEEALSSAFAPSLL